MRGGVVRGGSVEELRGNHGGEVEYVRGGAVREN